jgi:hypothetical protein
MKGKWMRGLLGLTWWVLIVLGAFGCSVGSKGECGLDWDCPPGQYCIDNLCIAPGGGSVDDTKDDPGGGGTGEPVAGEVMRSSWGPGEGQLGRSEPDEGSVEGPMSFAVSGSGEIFVLDQINERIQVFLDGIRVRTIPIPGSTFEDIELDRDGGIWLLDRSVRQSVVLLDPLGDIQGEVALAGAGVPRGGLVTGTYCREDGLWVEVFPDLVRIADASGGPDPARPSVAGLFSQDGRLLLSARLQEGREAVVFVRPVGASSGETIFQVAFQGTPEVLMGPFTDEAGRVYLGAQVAEEGVEVVTLEPGGAVHGRTTLPPPTKAEDIFRTLRVTADGAIYQLAAEESGAVVRRIEP